MLRKKPCVSIPAGSRVEVTLEPGHNLAPVGKKRGAATSPATARPAPENPSRRTAHVSGWSRCKQPTARHDESPPKRALVRSSCHSRPPGGFKGGLPRPQAPASLPSAPPQPRGARVGTRWRMRIWPRPAACALAYGTGLAPSLTSFMRDGGEDLQAVGVRRSGLPCRAARGLAMASRGQVTGKGMSWVLRRTYFPNGRNGAESSTPSMTGGARPRGRPTRLRDRREDRLRRSTAPDAGTNAARASCAFGGRAWIAPKPVDGLPSFGP